MTTEPTRQAEIGDRAEEEEQHELEQSALHNNIIRHIFPSPAALGAADQEITAQVVMLLG